MNEATVRALAAINRAFYRDHAEAFRAARTAPWQGWATLLPLLRERDTEAPLRVLDVGCGHGRFARFLREALPELPIAWVGADASAPLLAEARALPGATTVEVDVVLEPEALPAGPFDWVVLFGVLHGVPAAQRRRSLLEACARRLAPGGRLVLTTWRFTEDARVRARILAWNAYSSRASMPIDCSQLEPGDHLLPWGDGDEVVRYVHAFDETELATCPDRLGLAVERRFRADGRSGDQNDYRVLRRPRAASGDDDVA